MKNQIVLVITVLILSLCYVSYQIGVTRTVASYDARVAEITAAALKESDLLNTSLNELSYAYFTSTLDEQNRIQKLQRQLRSKPAAIRCAKDTNGNAVAVVSADIVRLLIESVNYKALPEATDQSCSFSPAAAVTGNILAEYTLCVIGKYNQLAGQTTKLIESVNKITD